LLKGTGILKAVNEILSVKEKVKRGVVKAVSEFVGVFEKVIRWLSGWREALVLESPITLVAELKSPVVLSLETRSEVSLGLNLRSSLL
jgi:hypothetical protein